MSKIRLHGSSSGYTEIAPVAASGNNTLTLPDDGTILSKDSNGAVGVTSITVGTGVTIGDGKITCDGSALTSINAAQLVGICTSGLTKTGGFGKILQVVHTFKQDAFTTSSSSPVEITGLNASITKTSASNKLLITVDLGYGKSGRDQMVCNLYEDSSELTAANGTGGGTDNLFIFDYTHLPATDNETISMRNVSKTVLVDGVSDKAATHTKFMQVPVLQHFI